MASVLASSAIDRVFKPKIGICWFSTKHAALRRKNKDWLGRRITCLSGATCLSADLFQRPSTIKIQLMRVVLVQSRPHQHLIEN